MFAVGLCGGRFLLKYMYIHSYLCAGRSQKICISGLRHRAHDRAVGYIDLLISLNHCIYLFLIILHGWDLDQLQTVFIEIAWNHNQPRSFSHIQVIMGRLT